MNAPKNNLHSFELCEGQRRGSLLMYVPAEKQLYKFKSKDRHIRRYICYDRNCKATAAVDTRWPNKLKCRVGLSEWHAIHRTQEGLKGLLKLSNAIKKKSAIPNLSRARLREVFDAECLKDPVNAQFLSFATLQRQLLNIRNQSFPNDPLTSKEVEEFFKDKEIMKQFGKSRFDITARFYSTTVTAESFAYTIFISPTIAEKLDVMSLTVSRRYYIDARHKVPNSSYRNFVIVHIEITEQVFPFIYILMSDRKEPTYTHMFRHIDENIFNFFPHCFMYDNDIELRQSLNTVFPNTLHGVTWFHYCQAVRRKAKNIKYFPRLVRFNNTARTIFQKFLALPLVRPTCIGRAFSELRFEINVNETLRADGAVFKRFIAYVQKEWVRNAVAIDITLKSIRISRQLENFNTRINKKLIQFKGFFKCISFLLDEDGRTCAKFSAFVSKLRLPLPRDGPNDANYRIAEAAAAVRRAEINYSYFFKEVTKRKNDIQLIFEEGFNDAEPGEGIYDDQVEELPVLCIICSSEQRSVLLMPCLHIKLCEQCFECIDREHRNNSTATRCPLCRQVVRKAIQVFC